MIVGMAGILDSSRFIYFLSQELKIHPKNISSFVLGGHGDSMVAMLGSTEVNGKKINELVKEGKITYAAVKAIDPKKFEDLEHTMRMIFNHEDGQLVT